MSLFFVLFLSALLGIFITDRPLTMAIWVYQIQVFAKMCVMHAMLIPIASFFAIRWKSLMVVVLVVCTAIFLNFVYKSEWYPWIVPYLLSPNEGSAVRHVNIPIAWFSLSVTFLLGLFLSIWTTFFAIRWKKLVPAIMGMCTDRCLNFVLVNTPGNTFYPWTVPVLFSPHGTLGRTFTNVPGGIISICFIFVLGLFFALRSYVRIEK